MMTQLTRWNHESFAAILPPFYFMYLIWAFMTEKGLPNPQVRLQTICIHIEWHGTDRNMLALWNSHPKPTSTKIILRWQFF